MDIIEGKCLCGSVGWTLKVVPTSATACNCKACRRYGALWAYGLESEDANFFGLTTEFIRGDWLSFHFCPQCGNLSHWLGFSMDENRRRQVGVNLRLTEPEPIAHVSIRHFDGLDAWEQRPDDGRCVKDMWF